MDMMQQNQLTTVIYWKLKKTAILFLIAISTRNNGGKFMLDTGYIQESKFICNYTLKYSRIFVFFDKNLHYMYCKHPLYFSATALSKCSYF